MIFAIFKDRQAIAMARVYEALDDVGYRVFKEIVAGNTDKAADIFRSVPAERQAYLSYQVIGCYMTNDSINGKAPALTDLDDFFKFVIR